MQTQVSFKSKAIENIILIKMKDTHLKLITTLSVVQDPELLVLRFPSLHKLEDRFILQMKHQWHRKEN